MVYLSTISPIYFLIYINTIYLYFISIAHLHMHICKHYIFCKYAIQNNDQKAFSHRILFSGSLNCLQNNGSVFFYILDVGVFFIWHILRYWGLFFSLSLPTMTTNPCFPFPAHSKPKSNNTHTHTHTHTIRPEILIWECFMGKN